MPALGSFRAWLSIRTFQLFLCLVLANLIIPLLRHRQHIALDVFLILFMVYIFSFGHSLSYGRFDELGITYRRYFLKRFLPWRAVSRMEVKPDYTGELFVYLSDGRRLVFYISRLLNAETETLLSTLHDLRKKGQTAE